LNLVKDVLNNHKAFFISSIHFCVSGKYFANMLLLLN